MFDIGFTEILVIATISLVVIGPERLPETVRTVTLWIGRFKRSLRETRREIEQQIGADEIRRELHNEQIMRSLEKTRQEMNSIGRELSMDEDLDPPPSKPAASDPAAAAPNTELPSAEQASDSADAQPASDSPASDTQPKKH